MKSPIYFVILIFESVIYYCKLLINKSLVFLVSGSFHLKAPRSENILLNCSFLFSLVFANIHYTSGQTPWTLQQCIDHAMQENTQIALREFDVQIAEINRKQSNMAFLPSFNAGATHGYNWGQSIDPFTNTFASNRVQTNNFYMSGNWSLFTGFQNYRMVKISKLEEQGNLINAEIERRNIKISVTGAYLQSVLNYQLAQIQIQRLNLIAEQRNRIFILLEGKAATQLDFLELVAQHALDSSEYQRLYGDFSIAINQLKQLLNIEPNEKLSIELNPQLEKNQSKQFTSPPKNLELTSLDTRLDINSLQTKNSSSRALPSLSVNGSLGTGYSGNNLELVNNNLQPKPLPVQMQENFYQSAVLNLSIPIFNQGNVHNEVQRNKIERLKLSQERKQLALEFDYRIEQVRIEINTLSARIVSLEMALFTAKEAFEMAKLKYENGQSKLVDFLETQQRLAKSEIELVQAQLERQFKELILELYY